MVPTNRKAIENSCTISRVTPKIAELELQRLLLCRLYPNLMHHLRRQDIPAVVEPTNEQDIIFANNIIISVSNNIFRALSENKSSQFTTLYAISLTPDEIFDPRDWEPVIIAPTLYNDFA